MFIIHDKCRICGESTTHEINLITKVNHKVIYTKRCRMCGTEEGRKVTPVEWELLTDQKQ